MLDEQKFFKIFLKIIFLCLVVLGLHYCVGFSLVAVLGFSLQWFLLLQNTGSRACGLRGCGFQALEHRLRICGTRAELLCSMWDLLGPGIEPVSPALASVFFTTEPSRKPQNSFSYNIQNTKIMASGPIASWEIDGETVEK